MPNFLHEFNENLSLKTKDDLYYIYAIYKGVCLTPDRNSDFIYPEFCQEFGKMWIQTVLKV